MAGESACPTLLIKGLRNEWGRRFRLPTDMLLKVIGKKATTVIFMGDIWKPRSLWDSRYMWMPVIIGNGKMSLPEPKEWQVNVETGETTIQP